MKALVLGGNGFIGSHVVDHLLVAGHCVRVFDRQPEKYRVPIPSVEYYITSFDDVPSLSEALEGVDIVYHLISTTVPSTSNKDPVYDVNSNLVGTIRLLELMRQSGVHRVVYLSSGGTVYGVPDVTPILESHPLRPICSYGIVKVAIENYLYMYQQLYGLECLVLRASNPYGERQGHAGVQGVIGTMMWSILKERPLEIWGDGSIVRDYIYVKDLASLCVIAGDSGNTGVFNAGAGEGKSVNQVFDSVCKAANQTLQPVFKAGRSLDVPEVILDINNTRRAFKWAPLTSFNDGVRATWAWFEGHQ